LIRAVIDTNITVSGLLFGGLPLKIIHAALARRFEWVTSPILMKELEQVLRSKKFALADHEIEVLMAPILRVAEIIVPEKTITTIARCPADNRVLECAVEGRCSVIVSGDRRDLLSLKRYLHVDIMTARQFLDRL
jgi:putative PIN family toxin of toxin-antitoxin system